MNFTYNLSQTEYLVFKTRRGCFEVYSGHEAGGEAKKIATYKSGRWTWETFEEKRLFWNLYKLFPFTFSKAIKAYTRSLKERPALYEFSCIRRKFTVKVTKLKRGWDSWFYNIYKSRR